MTELSVRLEKSRFLAEVERDGRLRLEGGAGLITPASEVVFRAFGIDLAGPAATRRPLCRTCLD